MAQVTFSATLPNGTVVTRVSKVKNYVAIVATAPVGTDEWTVASWHESAEHAEGIVRGTDVRYWPAKVNAKVIETAITKVVGATSDPDLLAVKAALKAAKSGVVAAEVAVAAAPADDEVEAASDVLGSMFSGGQTVEEAEAFLDTMKEVFDAAVAEAKADLAAKMSLEQKQALGSTVHALVREVLAELPEGVDPAEAETVVSKWLSYIPQSKTEAPARFGLTRDQKRALGSAVHAKAALALEALPGGVNADEAATTVGKWMSYIPTQA